MHARRNSKVSLKTNLNIVEESYSKIKILYQDYILLSSKYNYIFNVFLNSSII